MIGSSGGSCAGSFTFLNGADIDEVCYVGIMTHNSLCQPFHKQHTAVPLAFDRCPLIAAVQLILFQCNPCLWNARNIHMIR